MDLCNTRASIDVNDHLMKQTFAPYRLDDLYDATNIIIFKNPFISPYGDFYFMPEKQLQDIDDDKLEIIKLLQDTHLEYWKCPQELRESSYVLSHLYLLTTYYTDSIARDLFSKESSVIIHGRHKVNETENILLFSTSKPNRYFDQMYEIVERKIIYRGATYSSRAFQAALYKCVRSDMEHVTNKVVQFD